MDMSVNKNAMDIFIFVFDDNCFSIFCSFFLQNEAQINNKINYITKNTWSRNLLDYFIHI